MKQGTPSRSMDGKSFDYAILGSVMDSPVLVPAIDIYVTYRCNLRCAHCFVGDNLNLKTNFPLESLKTLIRSCRQWKTQEITFLGGEPTIYPSIVEVIKLANSEGIKTRLITNGQQGFTKFMREICGGNIPSSRF